MERRGDWMITFTGRRFWPLDPRREEVSFLDIAHGLSMTCRYGGHTRCFYSVAEHCVHLADHFRRENRDDLARYALLHDASEAYIGDVIRPLKPQLPQFKEVEGPLELLIMEAAGLGEIPREVHDADKAIIINEAVALFDVATLERAEWHLPHLTLTGIEIMGYSPAYAKEAWLAEFERLFPEIEAT